MKYLYIETRNFYSVDTILSSAFPLVDIDMKPEIDEKFDLMIEV